MENNKNNKNKKDDLGIVNILKPVLIILAIMLIFSFFAAQITANVETLAEEKAKQALSEYIKNNHIYPTLEQEKEEIKSDVLPEISFDPNKVTSDDFSELTNNIKKSIVEIRNIQFIEDVSTGKISEQTVSSGSGVIIGDNGEEIWILTNQHVVDYARKTNVIFANGEVVTAYTKGYDRIKDVAVLSVKISDIKAETKNAIAVIKLGDSSKINAGQTVIAIGNPLNQTNVITKGIVSKESVKVTMETGAIMDMIQTDAAINAGISGGALINIYGELIGIPTAKNVQNYVDNVGYAIPITNVKETVEIFCAQESRKQVEAREEVYLGVSLIETQMGTLVQTIEPHTSTYKSEMNVGDYIIQIGDYKVNTVTDLKTELWFYKAGDIVTIKVLRPDGKDYATYNITVKLERNPN